MRYSFSYTKQFARDYKKLRRAADIEAVASTVNDLVFDRKLDECHRNKFIPPCKDCEDYYIFPDLVLYYKREDDMIVLLSLKIIANGNYY